MKTNLSHDVIRECMFCILKCPKCGNIQGSRYPIKISRCIRCSTSIDLERMVGMKLFDSHKDMLTTIQAIKMKKIDIEDISTKLPIHIDRIIKPVNRSYIRDLILRSTIDIISFNDLFDMTNRSGIEETMVEEELDKLISSGEIFIPREGFLRKVDP